MVCFHELDHGRLDLLLCQGAFPEADLTLHYKHCKVMVSLFQSGERGGKERDEIEGGRGGEEREEREGEEGRGGREKEREGEW